MLLKRIALLLVLIHTISFSQKNENELENKEQFHFLKGSNIIGGAFNFSRINKDGTSQFGGDSETLEYNTNILIDYGYAIKNNLVIGLEYNYTINRLEEESKFSNRKLQDTRTDTRTIAPFVRKYFSLNKKILFDLQGGLGFSKGKKEDFRFHEEEKSTSFSIYIKPGITYKLGNRFALRASIGNLRYFSSKLKTSFGDHDFRDNTSTSKENEFNFNFGLSNLLIGGIFIL